MLQTAPQTSLLTVLREVIERMQRVSGADILSLYLYDAETQTYYAPVAFGLPEDNLLGSISDMKDQLNRYLADAAQGKAPAELQLKHYGPNVWLTVTRKVLQTKDAPRDIDSSFIRRYHIRSIVGLPLLAGDELVGILYLNYSADPDDPQRALPKLDAAKLAEIEREATQAAFAIERAREAEERTAFAATSDLAAYLSTPPAAGDADGAGFREQLRLALTALLGATGFDAAVVYGQGSQRGRFDLAGEQGMATAPELIEAADEAPVPSATPASAAETNALAAEPAFERALRSAGLHVVAALPLRRAGHLHGWLMVLSRDRLALLRTAPEIGLLLQTAADLITGALVSQRLIVTLEDTNRTLSALSRMSSALLQPGASRQQVLEAVVRHLTDPQIPEFAFQFATVFLLEEENGDGNGSQAPALVVRMSAGAATNDAIDATPSGNGRAAFDPSQARVPRWAQLPNRTLRADDVLAFAARQRQIVVVGSAPPGGHDDDGSEVVSGYPTDHLLRRQIPATRATGVISAVVPAILIGDLGATNGSGVRAEPPATPFVLDGDIFETSNHGDLVRVFVPFGLNAQGRATGVLEAGYHRHWQRQLDRTQIEALRAGAAQVAVAVETARLYEESKRHVEQLEITTDVSKAIASSIDLDQTLRLVARNLVRLVDASLCQIALYEEDGSAWYGAAASDEEELWRRQRGERPEPSFLFDVLDRRAPLVLEDAQASDLVNPVYAKMFGIRSLLALPLVADGHPIGAVVLAQRERVRRFTPEEVQLVTGLAHQAAIALNNARLHAFTEEERHVQKDVVLLGFGEWAQKAYGHLLTLKQFFNFKTHVVLPDRPGRREQLASKIEDVESRGDAVYWDSPDSPALEQLKRTLESSCYVITYIATPAATHLPMLALYYDLSNVVVIEKPLGASPEAYREFLDSVEGGVELVAADHYYFKLEVRLLQLLLTEERTLNSFIDSMEEIELELLEERPLTGAAADIGIIADMLPHAFAILSLFTPIDRIQLAAESVPLALGRQEPLEGEKETYARLIATFPHQNRNVRLVINLGKGIENAKWVKLSGEKRPGGRRAFYKFDFGRGEAIDGTQTNLRAASRRIREPGVPDNAHLTMLRHVVEKRHPAVGILAIREAIRSNQRIQEIEALANELLARGEWTPYRQGQRPAFPDPRPLRWPNEVPAVEPARQHAD